MTQPRPDRPCRARHFALRLRPGQDLKRELLRCVTDRGVTDQGVTAAGVVTCVGSLTQVTLRFANTGEATTLQGPFEIVSLVGTLESGGGHLHIAVADGSGRVRGGHLLDGSTVFTTAEVVLVSLEDLHFSRVPDPATGYRELRIERR